MANLELGSIITRIEIIDELGRVYVNNKVSAMTLSLQDNDKTLKIFLKTSIENGTKLWPLPLKK